MPLAVYTHFTPCIVFCLVGQSAETFMFMKHYFIWLKWTVALDTLHWTTNWEKSSTWFH